MRIWARAVTERMESKGEIWESSQVESIGPVDCLRL